MLYPLWTLATNDLYFINCCSKTVEHKWVHINYIRKKYIKEEYNRKTSSTLSDVRRKIVIAVTEALIKNIKNVSCMYINTYRFLCFISLIYILLSFWCVAFWFWCVYAMNIYNIVITNFSCVYYVEKILFYMSILAIVLITSYTINLMILSFRRATVKCYKMIFYWSI